MEGRASARHLFSADFRSDRGHLPGFSFLQLISKGRWNQLGSDMDLVSVLDCLFRFLSFFPKFGALKGSNGDQEVPEVPSHPTWTFTSHIPRVPVSSHLLLTL
jgi:hypothetical protein